jgi:hypothetical protein
MPIRSAVENQSDLIVHFCKFICILIVFLLKDALMGYVGE